MDDVEYGDVSVRLHVFHGSDLAGYAVAKNCGLFDA